MTITWGAIEPPSALTPCLLKRAAQPVTEHSRNATDYERKRTETAAGIRRGSASGVSANTLNEIADWVFAVSRPVIADHAPLRLRRLLLFNRRHGGVLPPASISEATKRPTGLAQGNLPEVKTRLGALRGPSVGFFDLIRLALVWINVGTDVGQWDLEWKKGSGRTREDAHLLKLVFTE